MARYGQAFKDRAVARLRAWLEAVIACAALFETDKSAWCREHGLHPGELNQWRASCTNALAEPEEARASPQATRALSLRIRELERDDLRVQQRRELSQQGSCPSAKTSPQQRQHATPTSIIERQRQTARGAQLMTH